MRLLRILFLIPFLLFLISCEPIRITTKVEPFIAKPPQNISDVKKIPRETLVILNESQISSWTNYNEDFIHTVEFPSGNLLKQALPLYFDRMFSKIKYNQSLNLSLLKDTIVIHATVDTLSFNEKGGLTQILNTHAKTKYSIYDFDLIELALPIISSGSSLITKSGLFTTIYKKEYGEGAYTAILESVKNSTEPIYQAIMNPKSQIIDAKALINKEPTNTVAYKVVANLSLKSGDIPEALAASKMIVQISPKDPDGYFLLYKTYLAQRQYRDAISNLEQAMAINPKNVTYYLNMYDLQIRREKYENAIRVLQKYIENRPDDEFAQIQLSLTLIKLGKYDEAMEILRATKNSGEFSGIGLRINKEEDEFAVVESVLENSPAFRAELKKGYRILEIDGKSTSQLKLSEIIQILRGVEGSSVSITFQRPESEDKVTKTLIREKFYENHQLSRSLIGLLAITSILTGELNMAKSYINEGEKIAAQEEFFELAKAFYLLRQGEHHRLIDDKKNIKNNEFGLLLLSIANAKLGRFEESLSIYQSITKSKHLLITPKLQRELFTALNPYLEKLENKALELEKAGKMAQALRDYGYLLQIASPDKAQWIRGRVARIISADPGLAEIKGDARTHFLRAEVLYANNRFEEAIDELEKAKYLQPFNPQIYFNKAVIHEKTGELAKAIENMEIFLQLNPSAQNAQAIRDQIIKWRIMLEKDM